MMKGICGDKHWSQSGTVRTALIGLLLAGAYLAQEYQEIVPPEYKPLLIAAGMVIGPLAALYARRPGSEAQVSADQILTMLAEPDKPRDPTLGGN